MYIYISSNERQLANLYIRFSSVIHKESKVVSHPMGLPKNTVTKNNKQNSYLVRIDRYNFISKPTY